MIRELIASPQLGRLLQDAYANYVMQSALMVTQVRCLVQKFSLCPFLFASCSVPLLQLATDSYSCRRCNTLQEYCRHDGNRVACATWMCTADRLTEPPAAGRRERCTRRWWTPFGRTCPSCVPPRTASASCPGSTSKFDIDLVGLGRCGLYRFTM